MDGRADAYSLACAAFEMLAGVPPFRRDQSLAVMWAQLSAPPPALTSVRRDLPAGRGSGHGPGPGQAPEDRYPSCRAFAAALQEACGVSSGELAAPALAAQGLVPPPPGRPETAASGPGRLPAGRIRSGGPARDRARGQTTPASPAAGFPAPPRAGQPTSADLPVRLLRRRGAPAWPRRRGRPFPPAPGQRGAALPEPAGPAGEPSYVPPRAAPSQSRLAPPASAGPFHVTPPAGADASWAGRPASRRSDRATRPTGRSDRAGGAAGWPCSPPACSCWPCSPPGWRCGKEGP